MRTISFAIPVYRNQGSLEITYRRIHDYFETTLSRFKFEIIFVNDGSDDNSLRELNSIKDRDSRVQVFSFTRNFGQMAAITCALEKTSGDASVVISADLQDPIELIGSMVNEWENGAETVICYRTDRRDPFLTKVTSMIFYSVIRKTYPTVPPGGFDFILIDRKVVKAFNSFPTRNRFFQGDILWLGYKIAYLPYVRQKREIGKSQYNFSKRLKNAIDGILDSTYLPVRFMSLVGVVLALLGFAYAANIVWYRVFTNLVAPGWAPIMVVNLIIGGINMLMLGVLGEYIWRIYDEIKGKPNFILREEENQTPFKSLREKGAAR